jgi:hypothetical protein
MLCTFTTETGDGLIVRSDDIRALEDGRTDCAELTWLIGDTIVIRTVKGTAKENHSRILQEELDQIGTVELHRYRTQQLLAAQPTPRGRQATT